MFDYNKLWSLINSNELSKSAAAKIIGKSHQGFVYMMERKTMTVEDLGRFAKYFKVSPSYFFEEEAISEPGIAKVEDDALAYNRICTSCEEKDKTIRQLAEDISRLTRILENVTGNKKENILKTGTQNS